MAFGLTNNTIDKICGVFKNYPQIKRALIYGSRAKGNYKPSSDIDLTLSGENLTTRILVDVFDDLDELYLPYTIDLSIFENITNEDLCDHIRRVGIVFYGS